MNASDYLQRSTLYRKLIHGPYGKFSRVYAARLSEEGFTRQCTWRSLSLFRDLMDWHVGGGHDPKHLDEASIERFLDHRSQHWQINAGDRAALRRLLSALRGNGLIAAAPPVELTEQQQIVEGFSAYIINDRGLSHSASNRHALLARRFLQETYLEGPCEFATLNPELVIGYVERHALDGAADSGKAMCWSLRAFLRYLHLRGHIAVPLADCVPSIRRWRLAGLPTFMPPQKIQQVLDSCDRTTPIGLRDYAILMLLAKLGLRAGEVVALTLDDIDWRAGEILVHGKGRRQAVMPLRRDVGAAVVSYLRQGRPTSTSRHLFLRMLAPHVGFTSGCAITMIARQALGRAGIHGYAHHGAHLFRHSLATDLLRSGASFDEIGQLLRHESTDSTRIYAKLDIEKLRTLSQPWPGGVQ
ncbi:MAG: tyrosine-type recombinase/integrase [Hyphomicrobiales bacterium]|jgi:site-specific recombinase XerD|nr:tyrosine-type recombinase/integrase [Hyphomicrobiales bacterium]